MNSHWRLAVPLAALLTLHLTTLFGGFVAPNSAVVQDRDLAWAPPARLRFLDSQGRLHFRPFIYPLLPDPLKEGSFSENPEEPCKIRLFVRGDEYNLLGLFPTTLHLLGADSPAKLFLLGTDSLGRDLLARTLLGGRASLFAGLLAAILALSIGALIGTLAGYLGGITDAFLMRVVDLFLALPWLYLLLAVRAFLPLQLPSHTSFLLLIVIVGLIGWVIPARLVRGLVLSSKEHLFVAASRASGAPPTHLVRRHVIPQIYPLLATQAAILLPTYVLAEITLSFLGLGIAEPHPSWGTLLASLQSYYVLRAYPWMLTPALPLLATFLAYYALSRPAAAWADRYA